MKVGAYLGNQAHAPANSWTALISAYTGGASVLHFATRLTADRRIVLAQADDVAAATGTEGRIGAMSLAALRQLDFSQRFTPRGSASNPPSRPLAAAALHLLGDEVEEGVGALHGKQ